MDQKPANFEITINNIEFEAIEGGENFEPSPLLLLGDSKKKNLGASNV